MKQSGKSLLRFLVATLVIAIPGVAAFVYPENWILPLWLAALFGPYVGIRMGLDGAVLFALFCIAFFVPIMFRLNIWTTILALPGVLLWLYAGYTAGQWLYA